MIKQALFAALVAASLGSVAVPASAADIGLSINIAPPAPRYEVVPAPRPGYVWAPGYWNWQHNRHVWVAGSWARARPGYVYAQPAWVDRGGRWELQRGGWNRHDRDHDGVRDSHDHDRDNDGVRNNRDHDRDGDGVRNNRDSRPDNPRRN